MSRSIPINYNNNTDNNNGGATKFFNSLANQLNTTNNYLKSLALLTGATALALSLNHISRGKVNTMAILKKQLNNKVGSKFSDSKSMSRLTVSRTHQFKHGDVPLVFNIVENLAKKPTATENISKNSNPFMAPYAEDLYVSQIGQNHNVFLNKFAVTKNHVVLATKNFESQVDQLNANDFSAAYEVATSLNGFAFYNNGPMSGSSVAHKHMQILPTEHFNNRAIIEEFDGIVAGEKDAIELDNNKDNGVEFFEVPFYSKFKHVLVKLPEFESADNYESFGEKMQGAYEQAMEILGNEANNANSNVIFNGNWMFIALRSKEKAYADQLSINSLGFLGSYLLKNASLLPNVNVKSPLSLLEEVTVPKTVRITA
jgi:ATP adenylyltransferase